MAVQVKEKAKSGTVKAPCSCVSPYQDKLYGKGIRLFNVCQKKDSTLKTCTVCGRK
jgi:hypothetical protein